MTETVKTNLAYPRPLPFAVKLFLVAYTLLGLIGGIVFQSGLYLDPFIPQFFTLNVWLKFVFVVMGLYLNFLFLLGFYTGRRWLVNLSVIIFALGIISQAILYLNTRYTFFFYGLIQTTIILIFLILLYTKATRIWFAECKAVRFERKKAGLKSKSKPWIIISMIAWVVGGGVLGKIVIQNTQWTKQIFIAKARNTLPRGLCYVFSSTNKRLTLLMSTNKITQQRCNQLMPSITNHCIAQISDQIPMIMNLTEYEKNMVKISECSALAFGNKYFTKIPGST